MARRIFVRNRERKNTFSSFLLLIIAGVLIYTVYRFGAVYLHRQQMQDAAYEIVHRAATQNLNTLDVKAQLAEKAREYGLPENRRIELTREGRKVIAQIKYVDTVKFPYYTYQWPVEIVIEDLGY